MAEVKEGEDAAETTAPVEQDEKKEKDKDATESVQPEPATTQEPADAVKETEPKTEEEEEKKEPMPTAPTTMPDEPIDGQSASSPPPPPQSPPPLQTGPTTRHTRAPSLSQQSKMRSSSFRQMSSPQTPTLSAFKSPPLPPLSSDDGPESAPELFRKQGARLEELEKENKKLTQSLEEVTLKWKKVEETLEEEREVRAEIGLLKTKLEAAEDKAREYERLQEEVRSLERQNAQLLAAAKSNKSPSNVGVGGGSGGSTAAGETAAAFQEQLASKDSTIEAMEVEISNLKAKLTSQSTGQNQISELEEKLKSAEEESQRLQEELKAAIERADHAEAEKTSTQALIKSLEEQLEELKNAKTEADKKIDTLEKKLTTLGNLHKDSETRHQLRSKEREKLEKEVSALKRNLSTVESENARLREERDRFRKREASTGDDAALDELEDEDRQRLERRVRELEGEVFDLRRGLWREKRVELQGDMPGEDEDANKFDDVDLMGPSSHQQQQQQYQQQQRKHSSFTTVLSSGLAAFTGQPVSNTNRGRRSSSRISRGGNSVAHGAIEEEQLLDDEDEMFDEDAFARAQAEEEMKKRVEKTKEVKRQLKNWKGWRLDLVNARYGAQGAGVGYGEIFEV